MVLHIPPLSLSLFTLIIIIILREQAFDRTGRIVNITVAPQNRTDPPRLLNYLTAPHVLVWSAAVCSSSVPGVFEPSYLLVKDADGR